MFVEDVLGTRFGIEVEEIWGQVGHLGRDLQTDCEDASTAGTSLVKSAMLSSGSPEALSWSDFEDWYMNQKASLVICRG